MYAQDPVCGGFFNRLGGLFGTGHVFVCSFWSSRHYVSPYDGLALACEGFRAVINAAVKNFLALLAEILLLLERLLRNVAPAFHMGSVPSVGCISKFRRLGQRMGGVYPERPMDLSVKATSIGVPERDQKFYQRQDRGVALPRHP